MKVPESVVDVISVTGFRGREIVPLVKLAVVVDGVEVQALLEPADARRVGTDLIIAAHASLSDMHLRGLARTQGLDGDELIQDMRRLESLELP